MNRIAELDLPSAPRYDGRVLPLNSNESKCFSWYDLADSVSRIRAQNVMLLSGRKFVSIVHHLPLFTETFVNV